jgi:CelD/BcsL family acetyltransferase involved in cellulose biosynthesis
MGTAMKTHPTLSKFFRNFAKLTSEQGRLHLFFLKVGDQNVAVQFTMVYANRLWIYKIGFDEDWAWCSPGILLMNKVVKYCFENDLERCEFLGHDESWLHIWANGFRELISYKIYPKTLTGKLVKLSDRLRAYYHKMKAKQEHE